jgi:hypothetical protein
MMRMNRTNLYVVGNNCIRMREEGGRDFWWVWDMEGACP